MKKNCASSWLFTRTAVQICREIPNLLKITQNFRALTWRYNHVCIVESI